MAHRSSRHTVPRVAYRFVSGRPLDGRPRTDATWLHPGTRSLSESGRASRWAMLPGWRRQLYRLAPTLGVPGAAAGYVAEPVITTATAGTLTAATAALGTARAARLIRERRHRGRYVLPLALVLGRQLGVPEHTRPESWLTIPDDYATREGAEIEVRLPKQLPATAELKRVVRDAISDKLGMTDLDEKWHMVGAAPYVTFTAKDRPPARALFSAYREKIEAAPDSAPILGIGTRGKAVSVDLDAESPHILVSAGTGGGKSVTLRTLIAQALHHGARVIILDVKRVSHRWARGLPGVTYCRTAEEIHDALIMAAAEGERRYDVIDVADDETTCDVGPRTYVVAEEMNATIGRLKKHWQKIRSNDDPKESPAVEALGDLLFMGRACKMHVIAVAQLATARTMGGPEMRENFATRIIARATQNAWRMLAPEVWPIPRAVRTAGRVHVVLAGEAHETQIVFMSTEEAREYAQSGATVDGPAIPTVVSHPDAGVPVSTDDRDTSRDRDHISPADIRAGKAQEPIRYTLAGACREGVVPLSADALRQRKARDPEFPAGTDVQGRVMWTADELQSWFRNSESEARSDAA